MSLLEKGFFGGMSLKTYMKSDQRISRVALIAETYHTNLGKLTV